MSAWKHNWVERLRKLSFQKKKKKKKISLGDEF